MKSVRMRSWCVVASLFLSGLAFAADGDAPVAPAEAFKQASADWEALSMEIRKVVEEFRAADEAQREKLRVQYEGLVGQSQAKFIALRASAKAAYIAAPNQDPEVTKTLVRMLADDVRRDEYDGAFELGKLLLDNKCDDKAVPNYAGVAAYSIDDFENAEKWLNIASETGALDRNGLQCVEDVAAAKARWRNEKAARERDAKADDLPRVKMETSKGVIVIELFENEAPETVGNFVSLVEAKYYDGLVFHRVLPGFMAQGGDPTGSGSGGPGYQIYCECEKEPHREHFRGTLSMAHAGKNTGGSQFFLTFRPTAHLDGRHTAFGRVIEGFDVLAKIQRRDPQSPQAAPPDKIVKAEVIRKRDHKYAPRKVE